MYSDRAEIVEFVADEWMIDEIVEWFGYEFKVSRIETDRIKVSLKVSPAAMEHWAMQYINYVEILRPDSLRKKIQHNLENGLTKYNK